VRSLSLADKISNHDNIENSVCEEVLQLLSSEDSGVIAPYSTSRIEIGLIIGILSDLYCVDFSALCFSIVLINLKDGAQSIRMTDVLFDIDSQ
jgi:hypothetical protein